MSLDFTQHHRLASPTHGVKSFARPTHRESLVVVDRSSPENVVSVGRPLPLGTLLLAINQLAVMNQNGVDLAEAVDTVSRYCKHERLADQMNRIHTSLTEGRSLSVAIAMHGDGFPANVSPMLAAAESSGNLPQTLKRITEMLRSEMQLRATIGSALIYPVILMSASSLVLMAMVLGVIPQFAKVFESLGKPVPASTQTLLWIGLTCRAHWPLLLGAIGLIVTVIILLRKHPVMTRPFRALLMHGPIIRDAYRPLMTGRVFRAIAGMVAGGVTLLEAMRLARRATADPYWQDLLDAVIQNLLQGSRASEAMKQVDFLPPEAAQLVATAERTGRVSDILEDVGLFYEEDASRRIKRLVSALEPVIIMVMGVLVAGIVMSVMLPMLDVTSIR